MSVARIESVANTLQSLHSGLLVNCSEREREAVREVMMRGRRNGMDKKTTL